MLSTRPDATSLRKSEVPDGALLVDLVQRLSGGDQKALGEFYDLTIDRVYSLVLRFVANTADAEEVCGEIYTQVWSQAGRFQSGRGEVWGWLLSIARSRALDRVRRERRHRSEPLHPDHPLDAYMPTSVDAHSGWVDGLQAGSAARLALGSLSEVQQRMIALAFFEDLSNQEIAERVNLPLGTVKSHIRRGLAALREALRPYKDRDDR
jgi:RNA polymerase sigma-70 factor (ECF subfamily)